MLSKLSIHPRNQLGLKQALIKVAILAMIVLFISVVPMPESMRGLAGYEPLHAMLETLAIIFSALVFAVIWNAPFRQSQFALIIFACGFFAVGLFDFSHMLSVKGMPLFVTESSPEKGINFWFSARLTAALTLLLMVTLIDRKVSCKINRHFLLGGVLLVVATVHWVLLFHPEVMPRTFIQGQGLTAFKVGVEYFIVLLNVTAAVILLMRMRQNLSFNAAVFFAGLIVTAMSEYLFTLYGTVNDIYILSGHIFKIMGYLFFYQAVFVESIERPYKEVASLKANLEKTQEIAIVGSWEIDHATQQLTWSNETYRIFGVTPDHFEVSIAAFNALVHPDDLVAVDDAFSASLEQGKSGYQIDHRIIRQATGEVRYVTEKCEHERTIDGVLIRSVGMVRDITRFKLSEQALQDSQHKLDAMLQTVAEGIVTVNANGEMTYVNKEAAIILEISEDKITHHYFQSREWKQICHDGKPYPLEQLPLAIVLREHRKVINIEHGIVTAGEKVKWLSVNAAPLMDEEGNFVGGIASFRDVSERKSLDAELQRHRENLESMVADRTAALSVAKEVAEAASRAKSAFLSNMSHELRTPMNGIMGMAELALRQATVPKQKDQLEKVMQASSHLLSLINDILDISKIEAERLKLEEIIFKVDSILLNAVNLLLQKATDKGLKLIVDVAPDVVYQPMLGDPMRIGQVLINLLNNAIKFTEQGQVTLRVHKEQEAVDHLMLLFEVSDTGIGIGVEDQKRLFQVFEQVDTSTTRKYGGTGLGLALSKRLVEMMGGKLTVTSQVGAGSTFGFSVRLSKVSAMEVANPQPSIALLEQQLRAQHAKVRILLVEDDAINREVAQWLLEEIGLNVDWAEDGLEALSKVHANDYDLILMDMQMPNMNGEEATRLIRKLPNWVSKPIVAMTANAFEEDRQACLAAGMSDHLGKPITPQSLYEILLQWLPVTS